MYLHLASILDCSKKQKEQNRCILRLSATLGEQTKRAERKEGDLYKIKFRFTRLQVRSLTFRTTAAEEELVPLKELNPDFFPGKKNNNIGKRVQG